jgi:hypothetical protein
LIRSHLRKSVSEADLAAWLHTQAQNRVVFDKITHTVVRQSDGSNIIKFDAEGGVPTTLYVRENTASHLRRTLNLSPASSSSLSEAAQAATDTRLRERAGVSDTPVDPLEVVILRETLSTGSRFPFAGVATAQRIAGQWQFTLLQGTFTTAIPEGEPRASFGDKTYLAGTDDEELRKLVAQQTDYVARVEKARDELAEENKRDRETRLAHFHTLIGTGTLFIGEGKQANGDDIPISLEITAAKAGSRQISAALRNDGGWSDARPFLDTWKFDDATGAFSLNLMSRSGQALPDAGPLLATKDALSLAVQLSDEGKLTNTADSDVALILKRVPPEETVERKARLARRFDAALAVTRPDTLYHGTATSKETVTSEKVLLRFTKQSLDGSLHASFESAEAGSSLKRVLRGAIVDNLHRGGDEPIQLQMAGGGRTRSAKPGTLFAHATDTTPRFKIDGSQLTGSDAAFTYEFTRVSAEQASLLKKASESSTAPALTNLPRATGVHVLIDGQWQSLPRNGGSTSSGIGGLARGLFSKNKDAEKPAVLVFKGSTPPPVVPGEKLTLTFKGKIPARAKGVPTDYPVIEAASTTAQEDRTRSAPLARIASGFAGFGENRLAATVAQPAADLLTITFTETLAPGTYAVLVGTDGYEFTVK